MNRRLLLILSLVVVIAAAGIFLWQRKADKAAAGESADRQAQALQQVGPVQVDEATPTQTPAQADASSSTTTDPSASVPNPTNAPAHDPTGPQPAANPVGDEKTPVAVKPAVPKPNHQAPLNALGILRDRSLGDTKRNNAINELRAAHDPLLTSTLLALLDDPAEEERFRSFVAQHLGVTLGQAQPGDADRQRITDRLRLALTDRHFQVQREALLALVRVRDDAGIAIMKRGLTDPAWVNGRDLVVRCLFILDQRERIPDVRPLLKDQNVEVQIAAIYCLGQWKDEPSRLDIEAAAASSVVRIHDAAALALKTLGPSPQAPADKP